MGWASGSGLMSDIVERLNDTDLDEESRIKVYEILISCFEEFDCDTLEECTGTDNAFDQVFYTLYPPDDEQWNDDNSGC